MSSDEKRIKEALENCNEVASHKRGAEEEKIQNNKKAKVALKNFFETLSKVKPEKNNSGMKEYYDFYMDEIFIIENVYHKRYADACDSLVRYCSNKQFLQYRIYTALMEIEKVMEGSYEIA